MKIITTEVLISRQIEVPVITGVYDPLSKKNDGTVTSQAPIIVTGRHLELLNVANVRLCLAPAIDYGNVIEVQDVYKFVPNQVVVALPALIPGEYLPAVKILLENREDVLYIFPVSWVVMPEGWRGHYYFSAHEIVK